MISNFLHLNLYVTRQTWILTLTFHDLLSFLRMNYIPFLRGINFLAGTRFESEETEANSFFRLVVTPLLYTLKNSSFQNLALFPPPCVTKTNYLPSEWPIQRWQLYSGFSRHCLDENNKEIWSIENEENASARRVMPFRSQVIDTIKLN